MIFSVFFNFFWVLGILGPPYCGIGATIRIGREMLCLPYAGFFFTKTKINQQTGVSGTEYFFSNNKNLYFLGITGL